MIVAAAAAVENRDDASGINVMGILPVDVISFIMTNKLRRRI